MNKGILGFVVGLGLFSGLTVFAGRYSQTVSLSDSARLSSRDRLCVGASFYSASGYDISEVRDIQIKVKAESIFSRDNILYVTDASGRGLFTSGDLKIPYISANIYFSVNESARDICFQPAADARLSNIEITFDPRSGGYTPGPNPGYPPPAPTPEPTPGPKPAPPNYGNIIGEIKTINSQGEVFGWACDTTSRAALRLAVYVNGRLDRTLSPEANLNIRQEPAMGLPDRACGEYSGFKFQLNQEKFDGSYLDIEVRGLEVRGYGEVSLGRMNFKTPVRRLGETLFQVGVGIYYSNGNDAFCLIANPDQHRIFMKMKKNVTHRLPEVPAGMRNDGVCRLLPYPKGFFEAAAVPGTGFFSDGTSFCGVPVAGMLFHIAAKEKISQQNIRNMDKYDNVPDAGSMRNAGICMVEGKFQVGNEVYYSNGEGAYCRIKTAAPGENTGAFMYESIPTNIVSHGNCK